MEKMQIPFRWLFPRKDSSSQIQLSPSKDIASECSSPTLSSRSSPGKKVKVPRFIGAHIRPPLF